MVVTRRRGNAGDLQSDTDENPVLDEISKKLTRIQGNLNVLDEKVSFGVSRFCLNGLVAH